MYKTSDLFNTYETQELFRKSKIQSVDAAKAVLGLSDAGISTETIKHNFEGGKDEL